MTLDTLLVFTHGRCPHSKALLEDFRRRGVVFIEVDIGVEKDGIDRLRALCWEHRLPVVADHERISVGFRGHASTFEALGIEG